MSAEIPNEEKSRIIPENKNVAKSLFVAICGIMIALETVSTILISIRIPATEGYFNLGEMIIYFTAILFGPIVAMLTGGVGAALADIILGYSTFAPATLIIKGLEGFFVGYFYGILSKNRKFFRFKTNTGGEQNQNMGKDVQRIIISIIPGMVVMVSGYFIFELIIGVAVEAALFEVFVNVMQCLVGAILAIILVPTVKKALKI